MKNSRIKSIIKKFIAMYPVTIPAVVVCVLLCLTLFIYNVYFAVAGLLLIAILIVIGVAIDNVKFKKLEGTVAELNKRISADERWNGVSESSGGCRMPSTGRLACRYERNQSLHKQIL